MKRRLVVSLAFVLLGAFSQYSEGQEGTADGVRTGNAAEGVAEELSSPTERPRWDVAAAEEEAATRRILLYRIESDENGRVSYRAPDGVIYALTPSAVAPDADDVETDQTGRIRLKFHRNKSPNDTQGTFYFSIGRDTYEPGSDQITPAATLLHAGDDRPDRLYELAVDASPGQGFETPFVALTSKTKPDKPEGSVDPWIGPFQAGTVFYLMVVWPSRPEARTTNPSGEN